MAYLSVAYKREKLICERGYGSKQKRFVCQSKKWPRKLQFVVAFFFQNPSGRNSLKTAVKLHKRKYLNVTYTM